MRWFAVTVNKNSAPYSVSYRKRLLGVQCIRLNQHTNESKVPEQLLEHSQPMVLTQG
jgi:hypothetical protein